MSHGRRVRPGWARFRAMVLERAHYRCECSGCEHCGEGCRRPGKLEAAHVVSVYKAPEREMDPTNVRALCRFCHLQETLAERRRDTPQSVAWRQLVNELLSYNMIKCD